MLAHSCSLVFSQSWCIPFFPSSASLWICFQLHWLCHREFWYLFLLWLGVLGWFCLWLVICLLYGVLLHTFLRFSSTCFDWFWWHLLLGLLLSFPGLFLFVIFVSSLWCTPLVYFLFRRGVLLLGSLVVGRVWSWVFHWRCSGVF